MLRFLIFLVGMLSANRPGGMRTVSPRPDESYGRAGPPLPGGPENDTWYFPSQPPPQQPAFREPGTVRPGRRPRIPRSFKWAAVLILAGLVFRKVIAWAALAAMSATL